MRNVKLLEMEAENTIAGKLAQFSIVVAKPYIDELGGDLLAMLHVGDGARFIRVQCKGRSLENSKSCHIKIPQNYVTESFVCFLYLRLPSTSDVKLAMFFSEEISSWKLNKNNEYIFSVFAGSYKEKLEPFEFNSEKANRLIEIIKAANMDKQFNIQISLLSRLEYSDVENEEIVLEQKYGNLWDTTIIDKATGTEISGIPCPGDPKDFIHDKTTGAWISK